MSKTAPARAESARIRLVAASVAPAARRKGETVQSLALDRLPGWREAPERDRRALLSHLAEFALDVKDSELRRGLDRNGDPLAQLQPGSRSGVYGGLAGHPLMPRGAGSRTRRLLTSAEGAEHITLYWHAGWGRMLTIHAQGNSRLPARDVVGLTDAGLERIRAEARRWWRTRRNSKVSP